MSSSEDRVSLRSVDSGLALDTNYSQLTVPGNRQSLRSVDSGVVVYSQNEQGLQAPMIQEPQRAPSTEDIPSKFKIEVPERLLASWPRKCAFIVEEILQTEKTYVNSLQEIVNGYMYPLCFHEGWEEVDSLQGVFLNIQELLRMHRDLVKELEDASSTPYQFAQLFVDYSGRFEEEYSIYCTRYPKMSSQLDEMMERPEIQKLFGKCQRSLGHTLPLSSLLLKPVQRILRYKLLIENLHRAAAKSGETQPILPSLEKALIVMEQVADDINEQKRRHEALLRFEDVKKNLIGWNGSPLSQMGRFVCQDLIKVVGARNPRCVIVMGQLILILKHRDNKYQYKQHIYVDELIVQDKGLSGEEDCLRLCKQNNLKDVITLQFSSVQVKQQWLKILADLILESIEIRKKEPFVFKRKTENRKGVRKVASPFFRAKRRKSDESELAELDQSPQFRRRLNPVKYFTLPGNRSNSMSPEPDPRLLNPSRWSPELTQRHPLAEEFEDSFEISVEQSRQEYQNITHEDDYQNIPYSQIHVQPKTAFNTTSSFHPNVVNEAIVTTNTFTTTTVSTTTTTATSIATVTTMADTFVSSATMYVPGNTPASANAAKLKREKFGQRNMSYLEACETELSSGMYGPEVDSSDEDNLIEIDECSESDTDDDQEPEVFFRHHDELSSAVSRQRITSSPLGRQVPLSKKTGEHIRQRFRSSESYTGGSITKDVESSDSDQISLNNESDESDTDENVYLLKDMSQSSVVNKKQLPMTSTPEKSPHFTTVVPIDVTQDVTDEQPMSTTLAVQQVPSQEDQTCHAVHLAPELYLTQEMHQVQGVLGEIESKEKTGNIPVELHQEVVNTVSEDCEPSVDNVASEKLVSRVASNHVDIILKTEEVVGTEVLSENTTQMEFVKNGTTHQELEPLCQKQSENPVCEISIPVNIVTGQLTLEEAEHSTVSVQQNIPVPEKVERTTAMDVVERSQFSKADPTQQVPASKENTQLADVKRGENLSESKGHEGDAILDSSDEEGVVYTSRLRRQGSVKKLIATFEGSKDKDQRTKGKMQQPSSLKTLCKTAEGKKTLAPTNQPLLPVQPTVTLMTTSTTTQVQRGKIPMTTSTVGKTEQNREVNGGEKESKFTGAKRSINSNDPSQEVLLPGSTSLQTEPNKDYVMDQSSSDQIIRQSTVEHVMGGSNIDDSSQTNPIDPVSLSSTVLHGNDSLQVITRGRSGSVSKLSEFFERISGSADQSMPPAWSGTEPMDVEYPEYPSQNSTHNGNAGNEAPSLPQNMDIRSKKPDPRPKERETLTQDISFMHVDVAQVQEELVPSEEHVEMSPPVPQASTLSSTKNVHKSEETVLEDVICILGPDQECNIVSKSENLISVECQGELPPNLSTSGVPSNVTLPTPHGVGEAGSDELQTTHIVDVQHSVSPSVVSAEIVPSASVQVVVLPRSPRTSEVNMTMPNSDKEMVEDEEPQAHGDGDSGMGDNIPIHGEHLKDTATVHDGSTEAYSVLSVTTPTTPLNETLVVPSLKRSEATGIDFPTQNVEGEYFNKSSEEEELNKTVHLLWSDSTLEGLEVDITITGGDNVHPTAVGEGGVLTKSDADHYQAITNLVQISTPGKVTPTVNLTGITNGCSTSVDVTVMSKDCDGRSSSFDMVNKHNGIVPPSSLSSTEGDQNGVEILPNDIELPNDDHTIMDLMDHKISVSIPVDESTCIVDTVLSPVGEDPVSKGKETTISRHAFDPHVVDLLDECSHLPDSQSEVPQHPLGNVLSVDEDHSAVDCVEESVCVSVENSAVFGASIKLQNKQHTVLSSPVIYPSVPDPPSTVKSTSVVKPLKMLPFSPGSLQSPPVSLQSPTGSLQSPPVSLQSPTGSLQSPPVSLQSPSGSLQSPPVSLQSPTVSLQSLSGTKIVPSLPTQSEITADPLLEETAVLESMPLTRSPPSPVDVPMSRSLPLSPPSLRHTSAEVGEPITESTSTFTQASLNHVSTDLQDTGSQGSFVHSSGHGVLPPGHTAAVPRNNLSLDPPSQSGIGLTSAVTQSPLICSSVEFTKSRSEEIHYPTQSVTPDFVYHTRGNSEPVLPDYSSHHNNPYSYTMSNSHTSQQENNMGKKWGVHYSHGYNHPTHIHPSRAPHVYGYSPFGSLTPPLNRSTRYHQTEFYNRGFIPNYTGAHAYQEQIYPHRGRVGDQTWAHRPQGRGMYGSRVYGQQSREHTPPYPVHTHDNTGPTQQASIPSDHNTRYMHEGSILAHENRSRTYQERNRTPSRKEQTIRDHTLTNEDREHTLPGSPHGHDDVEHAPTDLDRTLTNEDEEQSTLASKHRASDKSMENEFTRQQGNYNQQDSSSQNRQTMDVYGSDTTQAWTVVSQTVTNVATIPGKTHVSVHSSIKRPTKDHQIQKGQTTEQNHQVIIQVDTPECTPEKPYSSAVVIPREQSQPDKDSVPKLKSKNIRDRNNVHKVLPSTSGVMDSERLTPRRSTHSEGNLSHSRVKSDVLTTLIHPKSKPVDLHDRSQLPLNAVLTMDDVESGPTPKKARPSLSKFTQFVLLFLALVVFVYLGLSVSSAESISGEKPL